MEELRAPIPGPVPGPVKDHDDVVTDLLGLQARLRGDRRPLRAVPAAASPDLWAAGPRTRGLVERFSVGEGDLTISVEAPAEPARPLRVAHNGTARRSASSDHRRPDGFRRPQHPDQGNLASILAALDDVERGLTRVIEGIAASAEALAEGRPAPVSAIARPGGLSPIVAELPELPSRERELAMLRETAKRRLAGPR